MTWRWWVAALAAAPTVHGITILFEYLSFHLHLDLGHGCLLDLWVAHGPPWG